MIRLALAELRADRHLWIGPLMVAAMAAALIAVSAAHWSASASPQVAAAAARAGMTVAEVRGAAYVLYVCTGLAAVVVLSTVSSATIDALRVRIARWRLSGAQPLQVGLVILTHMLALGVAGTTVGCVAAALAADPVVDLLVHASTGESDVVDATPDLAVVAITLVLTAGVCVVGALGPARRAARVPAVQAIRAPASSPRGMSVPRWILTGLALLGVAVIIAACVAIAFALRDSPELVNAGATMAINLGVAITVTIALAAPAGLSVMIRFWSAVVPARLSPAWFLARHSAAHRITHSTAAVVPLMIGASLYGILFSVVDTFRVALGAAGSAAEVNTLDTYLVLTPPALLTAVSSVAVLLLNAPARRREFAVLRATGATLWTMLVMAASEAVLYALTAIVLALVSAVGAAVAIAGCIAVAGLPFAPALDLRQALALCGATLVAMTIAMTVPAVRAIRSDARETLAPE
ncbi:FtsX-like permease family protein [Micromonospora musae]|uniref:FtsX-like permease family protein n=1 Tax=Micromonospora musae TaxID=1894970 RepID=UPI0034082C95